MGPSSTALRSAAARLDVTAPRLHRALDRAATELTAAVYRGPGAARLSDDLLHGRTRVQAASAALVGAADAMRAEAGRIDAAAATAGPAALVV